MQTESYSIHICGSDSNSGERMHHEAHAGRKTASIAERRWVSPRAIQRLHSTMAGRDQEIRQVEKNQVNLQLKSRASASLSHVRQMTAVNRGEFLVANIF